MSAVMPTMRIASFVAVASLIIQLGCQADSATDSGPGEPKVESLSPVTVTAVVGTIASFSPTVRVTDSRTHQPLPNVQIQFVPVNGGSVASSVVLTDANGTASAGEWQLSVRSGSTTRLGVWMGGRLQFSFVPILKADAPFLIRNQSTLEQIGLAGQAVTGFQFTIVDQFNNGVPNVPVTFTTSAGTLAKTSILTDNNGNVSTGAWVLGFTPGTQKLTVTVAGLAPLELTAEAVDASTIRWYRLESEVLPNNNSFPPSGLGIQEARFGVTTFDNCLCKAQKGFFVDEIIWLPNAFIQRFMGRYQMDGSALTVPVAASGVVKTDALILDRPDPDFGIMMTWIYRPIVP